jgi:hypothetical protein
MAKFIRRFANLNIRVLIMALAIGLFAVSCDKDDDKNENGPVSGGLMPPAKGKLTITGLSEYDGKYVILDGSIGSTAILGIRDLTINEKSGEATFHLVKITNGSVQVPLFSVTDDDVLAYSGNGTGSMNVFITSMATLPENFETVLLNTLLDAKGFTGVSFSSGNASVEWDDGSDVLGDEEELLPAAKGYLTINGLSAYNNKYIFVEGEINELYYIGLTSLTYNGSFLIWHLVKIENGSAQVPMFYFTDDDDIRAYNGNSTSNIFLAYILNNAIYEDEDDYFWDTLDDVYETAGRAKLFEDIHFTNGNGTVSWTNDGITPSSLASMIPIRDNVLPLRRSVSPSPRFNIDLTKFKSHIDVSPSPRFNIDLTKLKSHI